MNTAHTPWLTDALTSAVDVERGPAVVACRVATPGSRFAAGFLDGLILLPWQAGLFFYLLVKSPVTAGLPRTAAALLCAWAFGIAARTFAELVTSGRSPGKLMLGLRVTDRAGRGPSPLRILMRNALRPVDSLPAGYLAAGAVMAAPPLHLRLGDIAAGTMVIHEDPLSTLLADAGVPESVFTSPDDGFLLESMVARAHEFREELAAPLAAQLARHLHEKYGTENEEMDFAYRTGRHLDYLRKFLAAERAHSPTPGCGGE